MSAGCAMALSTRPAAATAAATAGIATALEQEAAFDRAQSVELFLRHRGLPLLLAHTTRTFGDLRVEQGGDLLHRRRVAAPADNRLEQRQGAGVVRRARGGQREQQRDADSV